MDQTSRRDWEDQLEQLQKEGDNERHPTFVDLSTFLQRRCRTLQSLEMKHRHSQPVSLGRKDERPATSHHTSRTLNTLVGQIRCALCNQEHFIYRCPQFKKISVQERQGLVNKNGLCYNCLGNGHSFRKCPLTRSCRWCGHQHHSLLHPDPKITSELRADAHSGSRKRVGSGLEEQPPMKNARSLGARPTGAIQSPLRS